MKNNYNNYIARRVAGDIGKVAFLFLMLMLFTQRVSGQASQLTPIGSTLANITNCDDCSQLVDITTTFPQGVKFGATIYTQMYVGSNGYFTFGHSQTGYNPQGIPGYMNGPIIAGQFDDLHPGTSGDIYYQQNSNELYATYSAVAPYRSPTGVGSGYNTFQIVMRKPGTYNGTTNFDFQIEVRYINMNWAKSGNVSAYPSAGWSTGNGTTYAVMPYSGLATFLNNQTDNSMGFGNGIFRWTVQGGIVQSAPTVNTTTAVSGINGSGGNSGGNVSADGGASVTSRGVCYSTSQTPTISNGVAYAAAGGTGSFTATMSGLNSGATYYVRAFATNSIGTGYGPQVTFSTLSQSAPTVSTTLATSITTTSASSGGNATSDGGSAITAKGLVWNTTGTPTISSYTGITSNGGGTGTFTSSMGSLSNNTTYYYRAYATNSVGTSYGTQYSLLTAPTDPTSPVATPSTICNGAATQLSVSNAQGTVYWYTGSCGGTQVGTGNPLTLYPAANTTYYARNINGTASSAGCTAGLTVTVNQPPSQPASASATVPSGVTGQTQANLTWAASTGLAPITYYWAVGTASNVTYESNYTARGTTTDPTVTATATGLTQSTTYYMVVKASNSCATSAYRSAASTFRTNHVLTYTAGSNGTVGLTGAGGSSSNTQVVGNTGNGVAVYARPNANYHFVNWSDNGNTNPRTEINVTNSLSVTSNFALNSLEFSEQPGNTAAGSNIAFTVRIRDVYGNTMINSDQDVTVAISTNPAGGTLAGTMVLHTTNGVASSGNIWINKVGTGYKLTATAGPLTAATSSAFNITPGPIDHFTVEGITDPVVAGSTTTPVVSAYDAYNNIKTNYLGTIAFSSPETHHPEEIFPANYTFLAGDNGTKSFTNGVTLKTTGERSVVVTGTVDGKTGAQTAITVTPAPIHRFTLAVNGPVIAGTPFTVVATVYDEFDNVKTNYAGPNSVTWTTTATSSFNGTARIIPANGDQTFTAGVATISGFTFFNSHETPTITITDGPTSSPGTTDPITVFNAPLDNFRVVAGTSQSAGVPFDITVTARDIYWNTCRDYVGHIRFKSSDDALVDFPTGLQPYVLSDQGVRTFTNGINIDAIGAYWVRAADAVYAYKSGQQENIVVGPGAFSPDSYSTLTISDPSTPTMFVDPLARVAGEYVLVTVTPRDAHGNLLYACRDISVLLDGAVTDIDGPIVVSNVGDGSYTALVRVTHTGNNILSARFNTTVPVAFAQTRTAIVSPAPVNLAHTLITALPSTMTTDEHSNITVQLKDIFDNNRITSDGTVTLATTHGVLTGGVTDNGDGTYSATLYGNFGAVGIAHITGSFAGNAENSGINGPITDTENVTITEGLPSLTNIQITANPEVITTNETSLISVQLKDQFANLITTDRGTIALSSTLGALSPVVYTTGGIYQSTLSGFMPGFGPATITGTYNTAAILDNAIVTFNEGNPDLTTITITANPTTMTTDGSSLVTVQLKDIYGNLLTSSRGTVALSTTRGTLTDVTDNNNGTYTATLTGDSRGFGDADITGILTGPPVTGTITSHAHVMITEGKPALAKIDISPASATMTTDETRLITVQLKDQFGNNLTTQRGTVTLSTTVGALTAVSYISNGVYTSTLSTTITGTATITGVLTDGDDGVTGPVTDDAVVTINEGKPALAKIQITASPLSITTDETSTITIQLQDQWGNNLSQQRGSVALTASLGTVSAATYQASGYYTATLTGDNRGVGTSFITGILTDPADLVTGDILDNAQVEITEGLPSLASSVITVNNPTMTTDGSSTVTIQLLDQFGNLIINNRGTVSLTSTIGLLSAVTYAGNGAYTATLTGDTRGLNGTGISAISGSFAGSGTAAGVSGNFTDGASVTITEGLPALATTTITADPTTMTTDETSTISVQLKDQFGNLITHDRSTVALTTTLGVLTGGVMYQAAGIYTATLYGNNSGTGTATLHGTLDGIVSGNIADDATVLITEGAPSLANTTITASPATITTDGSSIITVQLKDQFGNILTTSTGTVSLNTTLGALTSVTNHSDGTYTATLTGNATGVGTATISGTLNSSALAQTATVTITEGLPSLAQSQITANPTSITTDQTSTITVLLKDQWGNTIINSRGIVSLATTRGSLSEVTDHADGTYTAILSGSLSGFGLATITGSLNDAADLLSGPFTDDAEVTITEGKPDLTKIQITASPLTITTDEISTISIQLQDQWGNNLTSQRGTVALSSDKGAVSASATYVSNGIYTAALTGDFRGVGLATVTGVLSDPGDLVNGTITDNAQVTITEGLPSLATSTITALPTTMTTDGSSTITVQLKDQHGNLIINNRGMVGLTSDLGLLSAVTYAGAGTYTATLTGDMRGINGTGLSTISGSLAGSGTASGVNGGFAYTASVTITEGLPSVATTVITANPITMTTDQTSLISVQLKDWLGNLITNNTASVTLFTDKGWLTAVSYTGAGVYTATLHADNTGTGLATLTGKLGEISITDNATVLITEGLPALSQIEITANPTTMTTDGTSTITVQLKDQFGNVIINDRGTVTLTSTIGLLSAVTYAGNGAYTATLSGDTRGVNGTGVSAITGTFISSGDNPGLGTILDGATVTITEGLPNLVRSVITAAPTTITTDETSLVTVQLEDQWGNIITHSRGTVALSTDLGLLTSVTDNNNGTYTATLSAGVPGTGTATITGSLTGTVTGDFSDNAVVIITEGLPVLTQIQITADPTSITADQTSTITIQLKDQHGNNLTQSRGSIELATNPIGHLSAVTDNLNGTYTATFSLTAFGTGLATITGTFTGSGNAVSVNGLITDNATVLVTHGIANKLTMLTQPSATATAGVAFLQQPVVRIEDQFGNLVTSDVSTVLTATRSAGTATLYSTASLSATAVNGVATFAGLYYTKAETITLGFSSSPALTTAVSTNIVVGHAPIHHFVLNAPPDFIAGSTRAAYVVTRYDAFENLVTTGSQVAYLTSSSTGSNKKFYTALSGGSEITQVTIAGGASTASFWYYDEKTGTHTITASFAGVADGTDQITVTPTLLKDFLVYGVPDPHDLGTWQSVTVEARDTYNNRKTNYVGKITFSNTDISAINPADYQYISGNQGIRTFTNAVKFSQPGNWWLTAIDMAEPTKYGAQADITVQRAVTITANNRVKTYGDIMTLGAMPISNCTITGIIAGIDPVAGEITGITLASTGTVATATVAGSTYPIVPSLATGPYNPAFYRIVYSNAGQLDITKRDLTLSNFTAANKTYDGTTSVTGTGFTDNRVNSDVLTFSYTAAFATRNAGIARTVNYTDIAISGGAGAGNYTLVTTTGSTTANIDVRPINVTAQTSSKIYDGTATSDVLPVVDPLQEGDVLTSAGIETYDNANIGTSKTMTPGAAVINDGNGGANYNISYVTNGTGEITPRQVTITADAGQTKIYGEADPVTYTYAITSGTLAPGHVFAGALERTGGETVGGYAINKGSLTIVDGLSGNQESNYTVTYISNNFTITVRPITITANAGQTKTYGEPNPTPYGYSLTSGTLATDDVFSGLLSRISGENVGTYAITKSSLTIVQGAVNKEANYDVTYVSNPFTITSRDITITANPGQTKIYGHADPLPFLYTVTGSGLAPGDVFNGVLDRAAGETIGNYAINQGNLIIVDGSMTNKTANYTLVYNSSNFSITRRPITITANAGQSKAYGENDPLPFTYTVTGEGLATGDIFSGELSRDPGETVGNYAIIKNTLTIVAGAVNKEANYDVTYESNDFNIGKLAIIITVTPGQSKVYASADPVFTYSSSVDPLPFDGVFTGALSRETGENVASSYVISRGSLQITDNNGTASLDDNYTLTFNEANFAITKKPITITVNSGQNKMYGTADPGLTFVSSVTPLPFGGTFNGTLVRAAGETVASNYAITRGSLQIADLNSSTSLDGNYNLNFVGADFAITHRPITIAADEGQTKVYGTADPTPYTYTLTSGTLANGDVFDGLQTRETGETVGDYDILKGSLTIIQGSDNKEANYTVTYISEDFTITLRPITITADAGQHKTYGYADPLPFTYTVSGDGLAPGEVFSGALGRVGGETIGNYNILMGTLTIVDGSSNDRIANYNVSYVTNPFSIGKRPITITANPDQTKVYGAADPLPFTYATGGEGLATGDAFTGVLARVTGENVGLYAIGKNSLTIVAGSVNMEDNYTVTYNSDNFSITKRAISISVNTLQTKVYATADPVFTYVSSVDPLFFGGTFTGALARTAGENVASNYAINRGSLQIVDANSATSLDANYDLTFEPANFSITKKPITITVNSGQQKVYGYSDPSLTYVSSVDPLPFTGMFTGSLVRAAGNNVANNYAITRGSLQISDANSTTSLDDNYALTFTGDNFEITTRPITITANDRSKTYGDPINMGTSQFGISGDGMAYSETITSVDLTSLGEPIPAHIGTYAIATANAAGANGYLVSNYNITYSNAGVLTVNIRTLTLSNFGADSKYYDGTLVATGIGFDDNRVPGDNLAFTRDAAFLTPTVGNGKTVHYSNIVISGGTDMNNYVLASTTGDALANIYARDLTIDANDHLKPYGTILTGGAGSTAFTSAGLQNGETIGTVTIAYGTGAAALDPIGTYPNQVTVSLATGGTFAASNYAITYTHGDITVGSATTVSGYVRYNNAASTPMGNVTVQLQGSAVAPVVTSTVPAGPLNKAGYYEFMNVLPGTYNVVMTTTKPVYGSINYSDAAQANQWYNSEYGGFWNSIEKTRFFAGDVTGDYTIQPNDAFLIQSCFLNDWTSWAGHSPRTDWTFWKDETTQLNSNNVGELYPTVTVVPLTNLTQNFYALATGDFNRGFTPDNSKSSAANVRLDYGQTVKANASGIAELPVYTETAMQVGAISLILNFPSDKIEILDVAMNGYAVAPLDFNVIGNELRIGWNSQSPLNLKAAQKLLTVKVRLTGTLEKGETVRFGLVSNPLNEIADGSFISIGDAGLSMDVLGSSTLGITPDESAGNLSLANYPNPFNGITTLSYTLPTSGDVTIEIRNLLGSVVKTVVSNENQSAGDHKLKMDATNLEAGMYTATLKLTTDGQPLIRTIKIIRNH